MQKPLLCSSLGSKGPSWPKAWRMDARLCLVDCGEDPQAEAPVQVTQHCSGLEKRVPHLLLPILPLPSGAPRAAVHPLSHGAWHRQGLERHGAHLAVRLF